MPRLPLFLLGLALLFSACGSDEGTAAPEPSAAATETPDPTPIDPMNPDVEPGAMEEDGASETEPDEAAASGPEVVDLPNVGSMERPLRREAVCEELEAALLAMRINAYDLDLYAAQDVIDELRSNTVFRDPETGGNQPDDVASWVEDDVPGYHCSLSAGGDAWYRVQLVQLTDGRGDYATGIETTSSYAEGGP